MEPSPAFAARARSAAWSKNILVGATVLSIIILPFDFDGESAIIVVGLLAVTYFEMRVHRYFREGNPKAPDLGFRNQSGFAAAILVYGLYHGLFPEPIPQEYRDMLDADTLATIQNVVKNGYLVIGALGGLSQFGLAWYYRLAKTTEKG